MAARLRVAIDTNILLSALFWRGSPHLVLELAKAGEITLVVPDVVRQEAYRVVGRLKRGSEALIDRLFEGLSQHIETIPPPPRSAVTQASKLLGDFSDAPILASVIGARPDYFLSGDEDLLSIKPQGAVSIRILRSTQFLVEYLRRVGPRLQRRKPDLYLKLLLYVTAA